LTLFVLADTIGLSDTGTCVLASVHLVSMSFREEVALVEEVAVMVTEGISKLAGADELTRRSFVKVIDTGAAAATFASSGLCGLSKPSRRDNAESRQARKKRNRLQQGILTEWRVCTLTSIPDDKVVSPQAGHSYQKQHLKGGGIDNVFCCFPG